MQQYRMWIDGEWVQAESGKTYGVINPATGEEIALATSWRSTGGSQGS
jgi:acyl-CoA reductase-like NAD-dependent aldehyde dehydrogenase